MDQDDDKQGLSRQEAASGLAGGGQDDAAQNETDQLNDATNSSPSLYNPNGNDKPGKKSRLKAIGSFFKKHKKLAWFAGPVAGFGFIGLMLLLFLLASMLIPHFIYNVTAQRFALSARSFRQANSQILSKKIAMDSADGENLRFRDKLVAGARTTKNAVLLEKWRPGAIVSNLESTGKLTYKYEPRSNVFAQIRYGSKMTGIVLNGQEIKLTELKKWGVPFTGRGANNRLASVQLAGNIENALSISMHSQSTAAQILRTSVGAEILERLGYRRFYAWANKAKEYKGLDQHAADRKILGESHSIAVGEGIQGKPTVQATEDAAEKTRAEDAKAYSDQTRLSNMAETGEPDKKVVETFKETTAAGPGPLNRVINGLSSFTAVGMSVCTIVDGSVQSSAPLINHRSEESQRQFMQWASIAHQQEAGDAAAEALGAATRKLNGDGSIARSNAVGSNSAPSVKDADNPYDGPFGDYTLFNVLFAKLHLNPEGFTVDKMNAACRKIGSYWFAGAATIVELGIGVGSGGLETVAGKAAGEGVAKAVGIYLARYGSELLTKRSIRKFVVQGGTVGGATLMARAIVANYAEMHQYNGVAKGLALGEGINVGAETLQNEESRTVLMGAPMTKRQGAEAQNASIKSNAQVTMSNASPFERYLALTNANSLFTRFGYTIMANMNTPILANTLTSISKIFNPLAVAGLFSKLSPSVAAASVSTQDNTASYTKTLFGWTEEETQLINTNRTYYDLTDNDEALSEETRQKVEDTYSDCFNKDIGTIFAEGLIVRDEEGYPVADQGLCSPNNLGPHNKEFGDAVFRYRISKRNEAVMKMGIDIGDYKKDGLNTQE